MNVETTPERTAHVLRQVVEATATATGERFFKVLVRQLSAVLGLRYCFVAECLDDPPTRVATLAFWNGEGYADTIEYELAGTPCELALCGQDSIIGERLQSLFPNAPSLAELGAESYVGVALQNAEGRIIGHLAAIGVEPFDASGLDVSLLKIFAARAAAELERLRALERLRTSERKLSALFRESSIGIFIIHPDGRILDVNQHAVELLGYSREELLSLRVDALHDPRLQEARRSAYHTLRRTGRVRFELPLRRKSGRQLNAEISVSLVPLEDETLILGLIYDVSERVAAERALRLLHRVTAAANEAAEPAEAMATSLAEVCAFTGWPVAHGWLREGDALVATPVCYVDPAIDEPQVVACLERWASELRARPGDGLAGRVLERGEPVAELDLAAGDDPVAQLLAPYLKLRAGFAYPVMADRKVAATLVFYDRRQAEPEPALLEVMADVGVQLGRVIERQRLERERRRLFEQIQQTQKLESLGVLAGGIAHDFNNLLVGILGNVELAAEDLERDAGGVRRYLAGIERAARRAAELCDQMLAYSGKGKLIEKVIDLSALVREMADLLDSSVSKKARLELALAEELPAIKGDATQIRQVVMNLITNASEALDEGSGTIAIETGVVDVAGGELTGASVHEELAPGRYVYLQVADDGCGMDDETRARLFDPFFTTKFAGRGLGMAAVLGIVRGHRGAIRIASTPGKGSTFRVLLPAQDAPADRPSTAPPTADGSHPGGTILVVDDEPMVREVVRTALEAAGYRVETAGHGRRALEVFRRRGVAHFAAVLLDLTMPELSGAETLKALRQLDPAVRVILASGYSEEEATRHLTGLEPAGFLKKPFRASELMRIVDRVVGAPR
ncbi:MAG: response regulator [Acidobacteria bacterium]|nr:MAG: response regulator [Acidobacteriota bacterium]